MFCRLSNAKCGQALTYSIAIFAEMFLYSYVGQVLLVFNIVEPDRGRLTAWLKGLRFAERWTSVLSESVDD